MREYFLDGGSEFSVEEEQVIIDPSHTDFLNRNSLHSLVDFMSVSRENAYRDVEERLTVGLDLLLDDSGKKQRVYLKRHWKETKAKSSGPFHEASVEFENIRTLNAQQVNVPQAIAMGSGYINQRPVGFMMVMEVPGMPSDDYLKEQFPSQRLSAEKVAKKKRFIDQLAASSAHFHTLGYNHRDFYLCHTFVIEDGENFIFHLIDLQRVQKRRMLRHRWLVKDISQMNYSTPPGISRTDRMRFYLKYCGISSLRKKDKRFIKAVLRKTERLIRREKQGKNR